ncbi:MAG: tetratricopeptide (TPR) repeat protein, partial [Salibacteraceae bacterium]
QEQQNKEGEARILSALGSVYLEIGNYDLGLEYYQKSSIIYKEIKAVESAIAVVEMNIGLLQFRIKAYSEAKSSFEKALDLLQVDNNKFLTAGCYSLLAKIHLELNQLEEANVYAKKNLSLNKELDIESGILESEIIIAQITYKINIDSATKKGKLILTHLPKKTSKELKKKLYELLYMCYKSQNNLGLSLKMHENFTLYQDSIQIEKNSYAVIRETVKTDYELRIAENKLESQKRKAELEVRQLKRTFGIISISAIIISLLIFFLFSMSRKNKKRRNQLLDEIKKLKRNTNNELVLDSNRFDLSREKIELKLDRKLNETDWKVLNLLLDDPSITNKEIAEKAFLSLDGIGSTLRRMYEYFEIKESKYKKILLLLEAIKVSNAPAPNSDI